MLRLLACLSLLCLCVSSRPQSEDDYEVNYDEYAAYEDYYDYEDSYDIDSQDQAIGSTQAGERFPRQTFSTTGSLSANSLRGQRQTRTTTTTRPARQSQNQRQSARQTAGNPPLGPYRYGYAVTDDNGLDFNQQETSDGGVVTGQYSVVLPDGRIQTVKYSVAPDTGYVAEVSYSGGTGGVVFEGQAGK